MTESPPSQTLKPPPKLRFGMYRRFHDRYWKKHRGSGIRPIFRDFLDLLTGPAFGHCMKIVAISALFAPLSALVVAKFKVIALLSVCGLALDIVGVLYLFREWVLQYVESEERAHRDIDRRVGFATDDGPMNLTEDDPPPVTVARHLADGARDRLNEPVVPALAGIFCLCVGFAFQIIATIKGVLS